jgi:hypothetical protein
MGASYRATGPFGGDYDSSSMTFGLATILKPVEVRALTSSLVRFVARIIGHTSGIGGFFLK